MKKFFQKKSILILLILAIIPAFSFLLKPGIYWNMHDDMQLIRQLSLEKCLQDGQIPCRWSPDLGYGYGYPLFNFYPPMPYMVGQVFRTFGADFVTTVKLTALSQIVFSALAMYLLASSLFGAFGGALAALFYTYAPYHAVNIYVRGAMNEAWAAVFFPLIFFSARKLILEKKNRYIAFLALSFAGLLLSHNPMALTFTPFLLLWVLFFFFSTLKKPYFNLKNIFNFILKNKDTVLRLALSGLLAISLSAFYTIPVLMETKYVQIESMFNNYYHWSVHFTSLRQLFISNFWGDGASVWGQEDNMSFMVGYLHWIIPLAIMVIATLKTIKTRKLSLKYTLPLFLASIGFFAAFMTHERSAFIWKMLPPVQKVQFPWRFLNHTIFFLSLSVGSLPLFLKFKDNRIKNSVLAASILGVFLLNSSYFIPITSGPITDEQKFSGQAWINQVTSGIYDYLPKTARIAPRGPAAEFIDDTWPDKVEYTLSGQKKGSNWSFYNLDLKEDTQVVLAQLAYPGFAVYDKGQKIDYQIEPELGRITLDLKAGEHQIFLQLEDLPHRKISNYISLLAWSGLLFLVIYQLWIKKSLIK